MNVYKDSYCLTPVSKNAKGALKVVKQKRDACKKPRCATLKVNYRLELKLLSHKPCDKLKKLDGKLRANISMATLSDGRGRGFHEGRYTWKSPAGTVTGSMRGTTNDGTHRRPPLPNCEPCNKKGHMEGVMWGKFVDGARKGCEFRASYAINYDPGTKGQNTAAQGTIEGVSICPCK